MRAGRALAGEGEGGAGRVEQPVAAGGGREAVARSPRTRRAGRPGRPGWCRRRPPRRTPRPAGAAPGRPGGRRWRTRPSRSPSSTARRPVAVALHPGGRGARARVRRRAGASRCRRPGPRPGPRPATRPAGWSSAGPASSSATPRPAAAAAASDAVQLTCPPIGWLTDSSPPPRSVAASHASAGSRKSTQPSSPSAPACPASVVTSWPGQQGDPVPGRRAGQLGVVADRVVVGDREEVEAVLRGQPGQLRHGQRAV